MNKPRLSFSQIINMNVGFFGIQYSFGLQQTAIGPLYSFLGAKESELPILFLAGPVTGLLIQPLIGAISDKTWSPRWGRRKPFFLIGAILCSLTLFAFPFSRELWMAAGLLWILDAANNTAMEPYRAFIADKLPEDQLAKGFLTQSFFTGLGITLANVSLFLFQKYINGQSDAGIPYWVYGSFLFGSFCSISSVLWSVSKTPEIPPSPEELEKMKAEKGGFFDPLLEIFSAIKEMPKVLWQLALVYLFQWYALFVYWQFISLSIAKSVWNTSPDLDKHLYEEAAAWTGLVNGFYNIITFLSAFLLVRVAEKYSPKITHAGTLLLAAIGLFLIPEITNKYGLFLPMIGFGIAWASMMGVPYLIVVKDIPKEKYGVYMGIINMMIVIPMIIQTLSFGEIYDRFLGGDPRNAILFAGGFLGIAGLLTFNIKTKK